MNRRCIDAKREVSVYKLHKSVRQDLSRKARQVHIYDAYCETLEKARDSLFFRKYPISKRTDTVLGIICYVRVV